MRVGALILLVLIVLGVVAFFAVPGFRSKLTQILMLFRAANVQSMVGFLNSCGAFAAPAAVFLMVFQAVIPFLPDTIAIFANASMFGWLQGALLSWLGALVGAGTCFAITRVLGRGIVEKLAKGSMAQKVEGLFAQHGAFAVVVCGLLPFMPFGVVSYLAGLTAIKTRDFLIAAAISQLPAMFVYSYMGKTPVGDVKTVYAAVLTILAIAVLAVLVKRIVDEGHR